MQADLSRRRPAVLDMPRNARPKGSEKGIYGIRSLVMLLAALIVLLLYAIFVSSTGIWGYRHQLDQVAELEGRVQKLKEENQKVFDKLQYLKKSAEVQERLVRDRLGWAREGELVIEFLSPESENVR